MQLPITKVNSKGRITLRRMLPEPGEVLVQPGQPVEASTVVAQAEVPGRYRVIDLSRFDKKADSDISEVVRVQQGDYVDQGQVIAAGSGGLSFLQSSVRAPAAGRVANIGTRSILLETDRTLTQVEAFINGVVSRVLGDQGVLIEADGAIVEAACGFGGEVVGRLRRIVNSPYELMMEDAINENVSESIVLGGRTVDEEILRKAEEWKVKGIIVGSIDAALLNLDPPTDVVVVATEGFGDLSMSAYTFGILTSLSRKEVSIRGQMPEPDRQLQGQGLEGLPIVLAAQPSRARQHVTRSEDTPILTAEPGSRVRLIQGKRLGTSGTIESIPSEPQATSSGIIVPGAYVNLNNEVIYVPWANLEQLA